MDRDPEPVPFEEDPNAAFERLWPAKYADFRKSFSRVTVLRLLNLHNEYTAGRIGGPFDGIHAYGERFLS